MSKAKIPNVEVFVHNKQAASITCPFCGLLKSMDVGKVRDIAHWSVGATCKRCTHKFHVSFNFRKYYRKGTYLRGELFLSAEEGSKLGEVRISDISLAGVGFVEDGLVLTVGEELVLRFYLDDASRTEIVKEVRIESLRQSKVGASFANGGFDPLLCKYIMAK